MFFIINFLNKNKKKDKYIDYIVYDYYKKGEKNLHGKQIKRVFVRMVRAKYR